MDVIGTYCPNPLQDMLSENLDGSCDCRRVR